MTTTPADTRFASGRATHTREFWSAAQAGEFVLEHCGHCDRYSHPPVGACRRCGGQVRFVPVEGSGVIYSATRMHYQAVPEGIRRVPYWVAVVALDVQDGLRIVVPVEDSPDEWVQPDATVRIVVRELPGGGQRIPVAIVVGPPDRPGPEHTPGTPARPARTIEQADVTVDDHVDVADEKTFVLVERLPLEQDGTVAVLLTLNRPEARNPLDHGTLFQLIAAMEEADQDPDVRTILITGAGEAFSAGGDLKVYLQTNRDPVAWPEAREASQRAFKAIRSCSTPVVVLVNGTAVAGGLEIILHSDFAYVAESARIGDAHLRYGQMGGGGALAILPRLIGPARTRELVFSGRLLTATEAYEWGLVNRVVPDAELLDAGLEFANRVARMSPLALANAKHVINEGLEHGLGIAAHMRLEFERAVRYNLSSHDASEGLRAFSEKRTPEYLGR